ncbi:MAG: Leucine--tRNA ligase [Candidatus Aminicenantes bacterium ADurb.Bin147]|nr:MAG: Leucine--tRNA ligase [Candidatus Aminicenantes bacterium ADurb.Bin147]
MIYSRFFTKLLRDLGLTALDEPFPHYLAQGMVTMGGAAMSKSKGNVVDPDEMLGHYGADALRLFVLFAAPPEKEFAWNEEGIEGCYRFVGRVWQLYLEIPGAAARLRKKIHQTIRKVGEDIELRFHLNTAVSAVMELANVLRKEKEALRNSAEGRALLAEGMEALILALAPFTPHVCEEMWRGTGHETLVLRAPWPSFDPVLAMEEKATIVVEINGKVRDKFETEHDAAEEAVKEAALALPRIRELLEGKTVRKVVVIKGKIVNIVV